MQPHYMWNKPLPYSRLLSPESIPIHCKHLNQQHETTEKGLGKQMFGVGITYCLSAHRHVCGASLALLFSFGGKGIGLLSFANSYAC